MTQDHKKLQKFSIFDNLTLDQIEKISRILQIKTYRKGDVITREGEIGDALFLLLTGMVEVSKSLTLMIGRGDVDTRDKALVHLSADKAPFFGEMAVLSPESKRSATVRAMDDCLLGMIRRDDLTAIFEADPALGYRVLCNIAKTLVAHLEKANQDISKLTTAFSLALSS
ncbi:cyclic nucleotide-binding domain-containing protein [candidate division KSB1 bacterium]|nr:cyclic nucleotide-binding domain-containing protein [candidate division KSB1 bacterium]